MMVLSKQTETQHLLLRAGFGESPRRVQELSQLPRRQLVRQLFDDSAEITPLRVVDDNSETKKNIKEMVSNGLEPLRAKQMIKEARQKIGDLNLLWLDQMAQSRAVLREKMTLFWHGHFACRSRNPFFVQNQNNTLRQHALGNFGEMLLAISKDPAMLQFLNNQQNRKASPNENFAREVMELFTMGRKNYTEHDIREAARAFTGWGFTPEGTFVFRRLFHDEGAKTFFGKSGNWGGEDIIRMILEREETAQFVTRKIYRYFVSESVDEARVNSLARQFYRSGYNIADLMERIFTADWFYDPAHVGRRIKAPVELLVGLQRSFGLNYGEKQSVLFMQKALGQVVFYPPNVAGWPGGRAWIDSSSLLLRMKLPELIFRGAELTFKAKEEGDVNTDNLSKKGGQFLKVTVDWPAFETAFAGLQGHTLLDALSGYLLQRPLAQTQRELILKKAPDSSVKNMALALMTLPEYQVS